MNILKGALKMSDSDLSKMNIKSNQNRRHPNRNDESKMNVMGTKFEQTPSSPQARTEMLEFMAFLQDFNNELETTLDLIAPNPFLRMVLHLLEAHFDGKTVTPTSLISASRVPYATANRRLKDMHDAGLIEQRPRTQSGKSFSMHPSEKLLSQWVQLFGRLRRLGEAEFGGQLGNPETKDYYFGGSYASARSIPPLRALSKPLKLAGGIKVLVHGDPTFMIMDNLKRRFEQVIGTQIHQRAFSIDRLREEALRNAQRTNSQYDIIAVDLPWIGEFAEKSVLMPLDQAMDIAQLDPADFHTAGWKGAHWGGRPYAVPAQTTPELLFYRKDLFAKAGLTPPSTTDELLSSAQALHDPRHGRYGIAWNAAKGTALGHTVLMTIADFGQPVLNMPEIAGGYGTDDLASGSYRPTIDTERGLQAAEFLMKLMEYSPPDILSMSWYERVRPYASGKIAMAYGYTLLAPYFELDETSPACGQTGYLPHPTAAGIDPIAPVGGYVMGIPANLAPERVRAAVEALLVFTSPEAQKLYVQNGSCTIPRYSVGADPDVRRISPIFEAVDAMSWRDELQYWPRPPVPEICDIIQICGEEFHDMLRGIVSPREALRRSQGRADALFQPNQSP
ncbi:ABC transporter substrate-binding protein [Pseudophaeobacter flagellatus]|uniref:ABC transporter substrate-binding protein n=1 Tax=Pseudophaeobacter flagellatus TaxID=2899119 RepID=UPI001E443ED9|nr:extracellular solute-binding protein [Pseudophaeobacter flagellatus]MCD9149298.1 extracellular solute-binding protein [Pseudophaeobacter flagellatus]